LHYLNYSTVGNWHAEVLHNLHWLCCNRSYPIHGSLRYWTAKKWLQSSR